MFITVSVPKNEQLNSYAPGSCEREKLKKALSELHNDFIFAHTSADVKSLAVACLRGAFEFQGQKCSAASRLYIPDTIYDEWFKEMVEMLETVKMGDVMDFSNFINAVIDKESFDRIKNYIDYAKNSPVAEIIWGGNCDDSVGYFIQPTLIKTTDPMFCTMQEEIFGPVLTVYVYPEKRFPLA